MIEEKQVNPRLSKKVYDRLVKDSVKNDMSRNEMAALRLEQFYTILQQKRERGDIILMRSLLKRLLEKDENIEENAKLTGMDILAEMKMQVDKLTIDELDKRITEWHNLNQFQINSFDNKERRKYIIKHDMGLKWSHFQCISYKTMFEGIGETVTSHKFDDVSFTIEISKQS